jgi:hypothetical protein
VDVDTAYGDDLAKAACELMSAMAAEGVSAHQRL